MPEDINSLLSDFGVDPNAGTPDAGQDGQTQDPVTPDAGNAGTDAGTATDNSNADTGTDGNSDDGNAQAEANAQAQIEQQRVNSLHLMQHLMM